MTPSLFSILDPGYTFSYFNWIVILFPLIFLPVCYFYGGITNPFKLLSWQTWGLSPSICWPLFMKLVVSVLSFVWLLNTIGLTPYTLAITSHCGAPMMISLSGWASIVLFSLVAQAGVRAAQLTPSGSPLPIAPFMVLIETVGLIVRPVALSVRLIANITGGHLMLSLSCSMVGSGLVLSALGCLSSVVLMFAESFVAFIQGYVMFMLLSMYMEEV